MESSRGRRMRRFAMSVGVFLLYAFLGFALSGILVAPVVTAALA